MSTKGANDCAKQTKQPVQFKLMLSFSCFTHKMRLHSWSVNDLIVVYCYFLAFDAERLVSTKEISVKVFTPMLRPLQLKLCIYAI